MAKSSPLEEQQVINLDLESPLHHHRHRCCFNLPCFPSSTSTHHITLGSTGPTTSAPPFWARLWAPPLWAFKKVREWSEIVAGPKWKTFIRRFNRRGRTTHHRHHNTHQFQYDPLSYALNFDEGPGQGQNCHFDENDDVALHNPFPDFSSRLAASPNSPSAKVSINLGNGASQ